MKGVLLIKDNSVRKIKNTGSRKNTGFFPSIKNERPVAFESLLELDYLYLLEFDDNALKYQEQPLTICYSIGKRNYRYTPDFLVTYHGKKQIIEVKPKKVFEKMMAAMQKKRKFLAAQQYCKANGYEFKIVTDENIRSGCLLKNIKYLFSFSRLQVPAADRLNIRNQLIDSDPIQISALLNTISNGRADMRKKYSYILSMLYSKAIHTDLLKPINKQSVIWL